MSDTQKCRYCGGENTRMNVAKTLFCLDCWICYGTKRGVKSIPQRMLDHPLYKQLGYRIRQRDPDAHLLNMGGRGE